MKCKTIQHTYLSNFSKTKEAGDVTEKRRKQTEPSLLRARRWALQQIGWARPKPP